MPITLALPALGKSIGYALAALFGSIAMWYMGKRLAGWINEIKGPENANKADSGRATADASNQDINNQLSNLPKE